MSQKEGAGATETGDIPDRHDGNQAVRVPWATGADMPVIDLPTVDMPEDGWADDDFTAAEEEAGGLASPPFLGAALRRQAWLWCLMGLIGLVLGLGYTVARPPADQASTSILVAHNPNENPADAILTDVALAQSRTVAVGAMRKLGLPETQESIAKFQGSYVVAEVTDRLILILAKGPGSNQAVAHAKALAAVFLQLRAHELQSQQSLTVATVNQQITQAKQQLAALTKKIGAISPAATSPAVPGSATVPTPPPSLTPAQKSQLARLDTQRIQEQATLSGLEQAANGYQVSNQLAISTENAGTRVLDPAAPVHRSVLKHAVLYGAAGLVGGLLLGLVIVIAMALVSNRLRRRDDIARALGTPITLSLGRLRAPRWMPGRRTRDRDVQRLAVHLRRAMPASSAAAAALAVVAVDNAEDVARSLVALALSYAQQGKQVVLADLANGAPAARLLRARKPGIGAVRVNSAHLVVTVPAPDDAAPVGPLPQDAERGTPGMPVTPGEALAAVYTSADLLLTLVTLDPAVGADYLPTWADGAVVVVTAGRSSATRIHAVGEMIRIAGTPLTSTVLAEADKHDESLGAAYATEADRDYGPVAAGPHDDAGDVAGAAERGRRGGVGGSGGAEDADAADRSGEEPNGRRAPELVGEGSHRTNGPAGPPLPGWPPLG